MPINEKRSLPRKGNGFITGKKRTKRLLEIWKKCTEEDIRERFDEILDFFSKELLSGFLEEV
jgi:hypothetical protein